uniref:ATP synthase subunit a n=1 Tax=Tropidophis haetianus TaxID=51980 RepID=C1JZ96_TROHA|nr:ATP synthase F0 subunit 6 [Tropidophis haetianus]ACO58439.1 ATP synthase F0 subunit 6 [Tropidophis haetianus]
MNPNMFEQFASPDILLVPTSLISMVLPVMLIHNKPTLLGNRLSAIMDQLLKMIMLNMLHQLSPIGQKASRFLTALILLILLSNLLGLLPYTFTTTSQLSMNMALAVPLWLATVVTGIMLKPTTAAAHMLPEGSPTPLTPMMIMIETVSLFMRPLALGVRLTANITAGHLLMTMVSSAIMNLLNTYNSVCTLMLILMLLLTLLEMAVACIQAYVFMLLVTLYLQENT